MKRIPTRLIGQLSSILPNWYSHTDIDSLFLYAGAPDEVPDVSKPKKVESWLRDTNKLSSEPLAVLAVIVDDFFEKPLDRFSSWQPQTEEQANKLKRDRHSILSTLEQEGFRFTNGAILPLNGASSTVSLEDSVKRHGLRSVNIEIQRALEQVDKDPHAAAHYAGNVLEATLKAYLDAKEIPYSSKDTLSELWKIASSDIGLKPADLESKDLKKIASGMNNVVDGIMYLRNKKSGAHGKSEEQVKNYVIKPRHARLAINASHTVAAYVLEVLD